MVRTIRWRRIATTALVGVAALGLGVVAPAAAAQTIINYNDFSSVAGMQLNGNATHVGNNLRLTDGGTGEESTAYYTTPVSVADSFSSQFTAQITPNAPNCPEGAGDGLTFAIQNSPGGASELPPFNGGSGGGLGYQGTPSSFAIEMDTFHNPAHDGSNGNHVALLVGGQGPSAGVDDHFPTDPGFMMASGVPFNMWIDYDVTTHNLRAYASQSTTKPLLPIVNVALDLSTTLGGPTGFAGFTGATGACHEVGDILNWHFRNLTTTTVMSSANPSNFGQPVSYTATVCSSGPAPTGNVAVFDGTNVVGSSTLSLIDAHCSVSAPFTQAAPVPGLHTIIARYGGDTVSGESNGALSQQVNCATTVANAPGSVVVPAGGTYCISGTTGGSVTVSSGGRAFITGSVTGGITSNGAALLEVCGATVHGTTTVNNSQGFVLLGDGGEDGCAGNSLGTVNLTGNHHGVEASGNTVSGSMFVTNNSAGPMDLDETNGPAGVTIEGNTITSSLGCSGNSPAPTNDGSPNTAGTKTGQCATI
jgi:legume-like lectin family protein/Big-like domain-containing protein